MTDQRSRALGRVLGLMQKVILTPTAEESRTCAVIAIRAIVEHDLLNESEPKLDLAKLTDQALVDLFVAMQTEAARRQGSIKLCVHCGQPCNGSAGNTYAMYPAGWMHDKCTVPYVRKKVYGR